MTLCEIIIARANEIEISKLSLIYYNATNYHRATRHLISLKRAQCIIKDFLDD
jgi:hypothetical protein